MISSFINTNLIQLIYNETMKEYSSMVPNSTDKYHFIQYFNFFMGMRVTYNRAELTSSSEDKSGRNSTRKGNYDGESQSSFSDVQKSSWGQNNYQYTSSGGYEDKGGYIIHFPNDYTIDEAVALWNLLLKDGIFDKSFVSLAFELSFYNENYQVGVVLGYEFIQTNAGFISKIKTKRSFFESRYQQCYHQISRAFQIFLIILDIIYIIGVVWIVYENIVKIYRAIKTFVRMRSYTLDFYDKIDFSVVVCKLVSLGYRYYQAFNQSGIELKQERISIEILSNYIDYAITTESFTIVASLTTVLISIRFLRILMTQFPSFGALFETLAISIKDIINFCCSMIIIAMGFIITA